MIEFLIPAIFLMGLGLVLILYPLRSLNRGLLFALSLCFCLSLTLAYAHWGNFVSWQEAKRENQRLQAAQTLLAELKSPDALITKFKIELKQHPENAQGWYLLGRLYASEAKWIDAKKALARAYALEPKKEAIRVNYAYSLWQLRGMNLKSRQLFQAVLADNPEQPDALTMLAMDAYENKDFNLAIRYWQKLLELTPKDSKEAKWLHKALAKAKASE